MWTNRFRVARGSADLMSERVSDDMRRTMEKEMRRPAFSFSSLSLSLYSSLALVTVKRKPFSLALTITAHFNINLTLLPCHFFFSLSRKNYQQLAPTSLLLSLPRTTIQKDTHPGQLLSIVIIINPTTKLTIPIPSSIVIILVVIPIRSSPRQDTQDLGHPLLSSRLVQALLRSFNHHSVLPTDHRSISLVQSIVWITKRSVEKSVMKSMMNSFLRRCIPFNVIRPSITTRRI